MSKVMQNAPRAILSTFIKLQFVIKIFVLSIFEWPLKTGFTVVVICVSHWTLLILTTVRVKNLLYMLLFLHAKFTTIIWMY